MPTEEELKAKAQAFLRSTNDQAVESFVQGDSPPGATSLTADALIRNLQRSSIPIPTEEQRKQRFVAANKEGDVDLDIESGVGPATRAALSFRPTRS